MNLVGTLVRTIGLALMWAALWGDVSLGTFTAGAMVALGAQAAFPALAPRPPGRVNVFGLAKLGVVFAWMLVTANLSVTRRVFSPRVSLSPLVVDVALPPCSDAVATVVANAVTLTPGTLTLDLARTADTVVLTVHDLDANGPEDVRADVRALYELAAAAFPTGAPLRAEKGPT
ncbi:MAG TPA: Na+/H+ antiporter subunit E [Egibacteraceae bacterium]|nr:Na+/H+ antiporter subunit E [Egibacteraceae bacterium]